MANIASAKKRAIQAETHRIRNVTLRSRAVTYLKKARNAILACQKTKTPELAKAATDAVRQAMSQIDKMVPKHIFHKNKAARLKSRLNAFLKKAVI